jgi:hypothetical protein
MEVIDARPLSDPLAPSLASWAFPPFQPFAFLLNPCLRLVLSWRAQFRIHRRAYPRNGTSQPVSFEIGEREPMSDVFASNRCAFEQSFPESHYFQYEGTWCVRNLFTASAVPPWHDHLATAYVDRYSAYNGGQKTAVFSAGGRQAVPIRER